jgi:hypothetical protein
LSDLALERTPKVAADSDGNLQERTQLVERGERGTKDGI